MKYGYFFHSHLFYGSRALHHGLEMGYSAQDLYHMSQEELWLTQLFGEEELAKIVKARESWDLDKEYGKLKDLNMEFYSLEHGDYPGRLGAIASNPYGIFVKGSLPNPDLLTVAIVGARSCSAYGAVAAAYIGRELSRAGLQVISGMARGIDSRGLKGALEGGSSAYGVLGSGADVCYPRENLLLYRELTEKGGIISEYLPGTPPLSQYFPQRNRIISGLSDIVVVVEAKKRSGSLITADYALEQNKEIYALPGQIDSPLSQGCHQLIRQGAGIFASVEDFLEDLSVQYNFSSKVDDNKKYVLVKTEKIVYSKIALVPKSVDQIASETKLEYRQLLRILATLELKGYIIELSKNMYVRSKFR